MLILHFPDERERIEKNQRRFFRKNDFKNSETKRYSFNVNGRNVIILEITEKDLKREDVRTLLRIYRGRVLVSSDYCDNDLLGEFVFSPKEYYQRALLSSLCRQIKTVNKDWKNICVKIKCFLPFREFYELVKLSKTVTVITENNAYTDKFLNECYYEYGAVVSFKNEIIAPKSDVYLNLDEIDEKGKLMINMNGRECILYSDADYFDGCPEYQKLYQFNIEHNVICSAFSDK